MEPTKIMFALFAVVLIAGAAFAAQWGGEAWKNAPDEAKKGFMQAMWNGDYATAKNLSEQYGLGGRQIERMNQTAFELRGQYHKAMASGNLDEALKIKEQMASQGFGNGNGGMRGQGFGNGLHNGQGRGMRNGGCPFADKE